MAKSRKPVNEPQPSDLELLRAVYRHLGWDALLSEYPSLGRGELSAFFRRLAAQLPPDKSARAGRRRRRKVILHTDGGSRGNPGPAGCGAVLLDTSGHVLLEISRFIGRATANQAEYHAVIMGLEAVLEHGAEEVAIRSDSQLLVRQLKGDYRVKSRGLMPLFLCARGLLEKLSAWKVAYVPREENARADCLADQAMSRGRD